MKKLAYVIATVALTVLLIEPVSADKTFTVRDVKGRYVFSFQGEMPGVAVFAATGVIVADGKGSITEGVRMITVNGVQDVQARQMELQAGLASRSQIVAESAESAEEIDEQNVADKERADALGLKYETHYQAPEMEPQPANAGAQNRRAVHMFVRSVEK
jgi:hypothetical protein